MTVLEEGVKLSAICLVLVEVEAVERFWGDTSLLHLLHLLNENLALVIISFFEGLRAHVRTWNVPHARFGQCTRHLLELIKLLVQDAHLTLIKSLQAPLSIFFVSLPFLSRVLLIDGIPLASRLVLSSQICISAPPLLILKFGSLRSKLPVRLLSVKDLVFSFSFLLCFLLLSFLQCLFLLCYLTLFLSALFSLTLVGLV